MSIMSVRRWLGPLMIGLLSACPSTSGPLTTASLTTTNIDAKVLRLLQSTASATRLSVDRSAFVAQVAVAKASALTWAATDASFKETDEGLAIDGSATDKKFSLVADVPTTRNVQYLIVAKFSGSLDIEARGMPGAADQEDEWERSSPTGAGTLVVNVVADAQVRIRLTGTGNATLRSLTMREVSHRQARQLLSAEDAAIRTYVRDDRRPKGTPGSEYRSRDREALLATGTSVYEWPLDPQLGARVFDFETIDVPRHADAIEPPVPLVATVELLKAGVWSEVFREVRGGQEEDHHWHRQRVALDHAEGIRLRTTPAAPGKRPITFAWGRPVIRPAQRGSQPDVVIVTIDALRADRLGVYGSSANLTPNLDRFGREGAVFLEARTACGKTWESLTATAYATWPDVVGVRISGDPVYRGTVAVADAFAEAGYVTARLGNVLLPPGHLGATDIEEDDHDDPRALARLVEIMNEEHERPIFAWLHLAATHYPYTLDKEFLPNGMAPELAPAELWKVVKESGPPEAVQEISRRADIAVQQTDTLLGRLLLPTLQKQDRPGGPAIVAIAADHGSHRGEENIWFMHATMNRVVLRVPFILSWPNHIRPQRSDRLVRLIDLGPTLLDLAGVTTPSNATFVGQSLRPILENRFMPRLMNRIVDLSTAEAVRKKTALPNVQRSTSDETTTAGSPRVRGVVVIEDDEHKVVAGDKAEYVFLSSGLRVKVPDLALYAWRVDPNEHHDISSEMPLVAGELLSNVKGARATVQRHISPEAARLLRQAGYASPNDSNTD